MVLNGLTSTSNNCGDTIICLCCLISELFETYSDIPSDLADGSLLIVSEITGIKDIVTIDSDYYIYRLKDRKRPNNLVDLT